MTARTNAILRALRFLTAVAIVGTVGCGRESARQSVDTVLKSSGKTRTDVFPLSGRITIDGEVPQIGGFGQPRIVVMLFDKEKPDTQSKSVPKAFCDSKGDFAFSTYDQGDGVAPGKYVLALVELKFDKRKGYSGADRLKNLYNDPLANAKDPDLVIDHQPPGKKDYVVDLKLAGREAGKPGPNSVTTIHK